MTIYEVVKKYNLDYSDFLNFIIKNNLEYKNDGAPYTRSIKDENVIKYVELYTGKKIAEYNYDSVKTEETNSIPESTESKRQQGNINIKPKGDAVAFSINYNYFDKILQVQSIRRMGIVAIILAFFNPVISLILGIIGKNRGETLSGFPNDLNTSLIDAIEYNRKAIRLSIIFIVIDMIGAIIGLIVYLNS